VVGEGPATHEPHPGVVTELADGRGVCRGVGEHPDVAQVLLLGVGEQCPEDRLRVAQHPVAPEGLVDHEVRVDRQGPQRRLHLVGAGGDDLAHQALGLLSRAGGQ
jgi:hypothetical protein